MAKVPHSLFSWQDIDSSSDILRLQRIFESLDDEVLMRRLRVEGPGRPWREPVEAVWNSLIAAAVCGHARISDLIRELKRNAELRQVCGFDPTKREKAVPDRHIYGRLQEKLEENEEELMQVFHRLVEHLAEELADMGERLAADGKAIVAERHSDPEAGVGIKRQGHPDGDEVREVTRQWYGYKLHALIDAKYELPLAFKVTSASEHESPHLRGLVDDLAEHHEGVMERAETLAGDKGYDDGADKAWLFDEHGLAPVIPARQTRGGAMEALDPERSDTVYISDSGEVACKTHPFAEDDARRFTAMEFCGFEATRRTLKFRCPAAAYGIECHNRAACRCAPTTHQTRHGRTVRIKLDRDPRRFTPLYLHSAKFERLYKQRTAVERHFYRLDHLYGFERHRVRSLGRARVRVAIAMIAMQATALGWIHAGKPERMRSRRLAA